MEGRLLAVAAILIFLGFGIGAMQSGYWDSAVASEEHTDFQEQATVNEGARVTIPSSNTEGVAYAPQEDINVSRNSTVFEPEGNWSWYRPNGTLRFESGSDFVDGNTVNVSGYYARPSAAQNVTVDVGFIPTKTLVDEWLLIGVIILILGALAVATNLG